MELRPPALSAPIPSVFIRVHSCSSVVANTPPTPERHSHQLVTNLATFFRVFRVFRGSKNTELCRIRLRWNFALPRYPPPFHPCSFMFIRGFKHNHRTISAPAPAERSDAETCMPFGVPAPHVAHQRCYGCPPGLPASTRSASVAGSESVAVGSAGATAAAGFAVNIAPMDTQASTP